MAAIREQQLNLMVRQLGADKACEQIAESLMLGKLAWNDLPPGPVLARFLIRDRKTGRPLSMEDSLVKEDLTRLDNAVRAYARGEAVDMVKEEASTATSTGAFVAVVSQLYFNATVGGYEHTDRNVGRTFRRIPSVFVRGEKFAGVGGLAKVLEGTAEGRDLPHLGPTEDYIDTPAQRKVGAIIDITWELATSDRTGEVMLQAETLGEAIAITREVEACGILMDQDPKAATATGFVGKRYRWKGNSYGTYELSAPWINDNVNALVDQTSINTAYVLASKIIDPWTGLPISFGPGAWTLFCAPDLKFTAQRIGRSVQLRTAPAGGTNVNPQLISDGGNVVDFEVVDSAILGALMDKAGVSRSTWYLGKPSRAFSWQIAQELITQEAIPGAGEMFSRVLERQMRCFDCMTGFTFNPRFMIRNTPS